MKHFTYYTIIGKDLNLLKGHVENIKNHAGFDMLQCPKEFLMIVYRNNRISAHVTNEILDYCHQNDIRTEIYDEPTNNFIENLYACWNLGYEKAKDGFVFRGGSDQVFNKNSFISLVEQANKLDAEDKKFVFVEAGHNLEPSEMGAAFGIEQLKKLKDNIKKRELNFKYISNSLNDYKDIFILPKQLKNTKTGGLAYPITIKDNLNFTRTELQIYLEKLNIQTRVVFTGNILRQPGFSNIKAKVNKEGYPEADRVMKNGILIGCHQGLNTKQLNHLIGSIRSFIKEKCYRNN
jgi:hypothetical protein